MTFRITPRHPDLPLVGWNPSASQPENHVVVIGSPKGGSGKTSTTLFCATSLAQMGARVLLIEATEGQAPLTQAFHPSSLSSPANDEIGMGKHLFRVLSSVHPQMSYDEALKALHRAYVPEAKTALQALRPVYVTPDKTKFMDFMPAAQQALAGVQTQPVMQQRAPRRAIFRGFLDCLIAAHPEGGWDFIFVDTLPTAESTVTKAALGVADSYALVVDMESSHPLVGFTHILGEIKAADFARKEEGRPGGVFKGLVLNRVATGRRPLVEKINRAVVAALQKDAEQKGSFVPILREIPRLQTLTLLGFNFLAVQALSRRYPEGLPMDLDLLTDEDVEVILGFVGGVDAEGHDYDAAAGVAWLQELLKPLKARLEQEAESMAPLILSFGSGSALDAYLDACPADEASPAEVL